MHNWRWFWDDVWGEPSGWVLGERGYSVLGFSAPKVKHFHTLPQVTSCWLTYWWTNSNSVLPAEWSLCHQSDINGLLLTFLTSRVRGILVLSKPMEKPKQLMSSLQYIWQKSLKVFLQMMFCSLALSPPLGICESMALCFIITRYWSEYLLLASWIGGYWTGPWYEWLLHEMSLHCTLQMLLATSHVDLSSGSNDLFVLCPWTQHPTALRQILRVCICWNSSYVQPSVDIYFHDLLICIYCACSNCKESRAKSHAVNPETVQKLWDTSMRLCGLDSDVKTLPKWLQHYECNVTMNMWLMWQCTCDWCDLNMVISAPNALIDISTKTLL